MKEIVLIIQSSKGVKKYNFQKDIISIGRNKENDIILEDDTVSNLHASLTYDPSLDLYVLMDLNSKNGTFFDKIKIEKPFPIERAGLITIGKNKIQIFPMKMIEGSRTVVFDIEDFKKNIPNFVSKERDEENEHTIPIQKISTKVEEKTILIEEKEKNKAFLRVNFLEGENKGKYFDIEENKKEIYFGRAKDCDFIFSDQKISRKHFKISIKDEKCFITNLRPINPIYVNEEQLKQEDFLIPSNSIIEVQNEKIKINYPIKDFEETKEIKKEFALEIKKPRELITYYKVKGPLTIDNYYKLENSLLSNLPIKKWAIIDFNKLSFIDYPALASLLKVIAEYIQVGGEIVLINFSEDLEKTFELVNVSRYINKFRKENYEDAIKYIESKI